MASIVNAQRSTLIGTPQRLRELIGVLKGKRASVVNLQGSRFVVVNGKLDAELLRKALEAGGRRRKTGGGRQKTGSERKVGVEKQEARGRRGREARRGRRPQ